MFNYVNDISLISHYIIKEFCGKFNTAVDATLGNGYDTDFICEYFDKVFSFDIQKECIEKYSLKKSEKVNLILDSHENIDKYIKEGVDCFIYNLGFLPGGNKDITTTASSTIISIEKAINLMNSNGIMSIALYSGHPEGKHEKEMVLDYVTLLPKNTYGVMQHKFINRTNNPPELLIIEKK